MCHQLGYARATRVAVRAEFGRGSGQIWMDNVRCSGLENALDQCNFNGWGQHNCNHREDAGVVCEGTYFCAAILTATSQYCVAHYKNPHISIERKVMSIFVFQVNFCQCDW